MVFFFGNFLDNFKQTCVFFWKFTVIFFKLMYFFLAIYSNFLEIFGINLYHWEISNLANISRSSKFYKYFLCQFLYFFRQKILFSIIFRLFWSSPHSTTPIEHCQLPQRHANFSGVSYYYTLLFSTSYFCGFARLGLLLLLALFPPFPQAPWPLRVHFMQNISVFLLIFRFFFEN